MKNLLLALIVIAASSCGMPGKKNSYNYDITYTDGTHEIVTTSDELQFQGNDGCIGTCGCSGDDFKRCGVRAFQIAPAPAQIPVEQAKPAKDTVVQKAPVFLKN